MSQEKAGQGNSARAGQEFAGREECTQAPQLRYTTKAGNIIVLSLYDYWITTVLLLYDQYYASQQYMQASNIK